MPHLLSLPPEIALRILDLICPDDFPSFILANKAIHSLCEARIKEHQVMIQKYSRVRVGESSHWDGDGAEITHWYPLLFLKELFANPHLAFYPTKLHIAKWDFETDLESQAACYAAASRTCIPDLLVHLAEDSWFQDEGRVETWRDKLLEPTSYIHHLAILLTQLPNLETLTVINLSDHDSEPIKEMVWAIARANQDPSHESHGKALSKLRQLSLQPEDHQTPQDYTFFLPFAALPSMRSLLGSSIEGYPRDDDQDDQPGMDAKMQHFGTLVLPQSRLEEICFTGSYMEDSCWEPLLIWTSHLKKFIYHDWGWTFGDRDIDFNGIIALLIPYASHSLEKLHLIADPDTIDFSDAECDSDDMAERVPDIDGLPEELAKKFEGFDKLRDLRLDALAFRIGPKV